MEPAELPFGYGRDTLVLMPRDASRCFAYWELSVGTRKSLLARHGEAAMKKSRLFLRVHRSEPERLDIDVSGPVRSWYFDPECPGKRVSGELVIRFEENGEDSLIRSREVCMPAREPAQEDPAWPVKGEVYARVRRALGQ